MISMDTLADWDRKEKRRFEANIKRIERGEPIQPPTPPPIPGLKVENIPDPAKDIKKIPGPEKVIGDLDPIELPRSVKKVLIGSKHENIVEAIMADLFDIIPYAGDVSNVIRTVDAGLKAKSPMDKRLASQSIDLTIGFLPDLIPGLGTIVGTILDAATPTNTINYLTDKVPYPDKPRITIDIPEGEEVRKFLMKNFNIELPPLPDELYRGIVNEITRPTGNPHRKDNPGRPSKEFWQKVYPDVESFYVGKYGPGGEQKARAVTASIWYSKMSPTKKRRYNRIRAKREKKVRKMSQRRR